MIAHRKTAGHISVTNATSTFSLNLFQSSSATVSWPSDQLGGHDLPVSDLATPDDPPADSVPDVTAGDPPPSGGIKKRSVSTSEEDDAAPEKKSIGSLARQNAFRAFSSYPKRSLGSLARTSGSRWYSKRTLASLARGSPRRGLVSEQDGPLPGAFEMDKRHIGAFARLATSRFHGPKRTLASLMARGYSPDGARSEDKRGLSSIARQGGYGVRHSGDKRPLASITRQGGFADYDRRSLASLVRQEEKRTEIRNQSNSQLTTSGPCLPSHDTEMFSNQASRRSEVCRPLLAKGCMARAMNINEVLVP